MGGVSCSVGLGGGLFRVEVVEDGHLRDASFQAQAVGVHHLVADCHYSHASSLAYVTARREIRSFNGPASPCVR
jgi:hypothetical protein